VFWRRRVFDKEGGFDESLRYVADCDYWMKSGDHRVFAKVDEVLAVDRDHPGTLRESGMEALLTELGVVRARYVPLEGARHRAAVRRHVVRQKVWQRLYWLAFLFQCIVPRRLRRGPWSRFLAEGETRLVVSKALQILLPGQGDIRDQVMRPSRYWVEPADWHARTSG
jgi:hypothetical protein